MSVNRPGYVFTGAATSNTGAGVPLPIQGCRAITVRASIGNLGNIFVGDENVNAANGFDLRAGESITLPVFEVSVIYHMASINGQSLRFIGVT